MKLFRFYTLTMTAAGALIFASSTAYTHQKEPQAKADEAAAAATNTGTMNQTGNTGSKTQATPGMTGTQVKALTDDEIAQILLTANQGEINQSRMALEEATSQEVKTFAQHIVSGHTNNTEKLRALLKNKNMSPDESQVSQNLKSESERMTSELKAAEGNQVDAVYARNAVAMHQKLLQMIDNQLLPSAKDPELKAHLQQTRDKVAKHLQDARKLPGAPDQTAQVTEGN